ncbi:MAG: hydrogenase maturation nickel metallochaperone HypA [Lentisphaerae bacterium RIFOXYA12_64_32]|nr:MAG: hydrogenase maturation nickel metallochaperone HypA [Lentisphaerae bacterium RIFOXYA12_64_32]
MHEFSIAIQLVEHVLALAAENRATRVCRVVVEAGSLQAVVPDALQLAFEAAAKGTLAEGAELDVREVAADAVCRRCQRCYQPSVTDYQCPGCGAADPKIVAGRGVVIRTVDLVTADDAGETQEGAR